MLTLQPVPQPCPEMMAFCARTGDQIVSVAAMASSLFMSRLEQRSTCTRIMPHKICKHIPLTGQGQQIQLTGMRKLRKYKPSNSRRPPQTHPTNNKQQKSGQRIKAATPSSQKSNYFFQNPRNSPWLKTEANKSYERKGSNIDFAIITLCLRLNPKDQKRDSDWQTTNTGHAKSDFNQNPDPNPGLGRKKNGKK